ncbi:hypothetical protein JCM8547_008388 [Rhodosporidiobolus lusitaniae]
MNRKSSKRERRSSYAYPSPPPEPAPRPETPRSTTEDDGIKAMLALKGALEHRLGRPIRENCGAFTGLWSLAVLLRQGIGRDPGRSENPIFSFHLPTSQDFGGLDLILKRPNPVDELEGLSVKVVHLDPDDPAPRPRGVISVTGHEEGLRDVDLELVEGRVARKIFIKVGISHYGTTSSLGIMLSNPDAAKKSKYRTEIELKDNLGDPMGLSLPIYTGSVLFLAFCTHAHTDLPKEGMKMDPADRDRELSGLYAILLLLWARTKHREIVPSFSTQDLIDLLNECAPHYLEGWRTWAARLRIRNEKGALGRNLLRHYEENNGHVSSKLVPKVEQVFGWTIEEMNRLLSYGPPPPPPPPKPKAKRRDSYSHPRPQPRHERRTSSAAFDDRPPPSFSRHAEYFYPSPSAGGAPPPPSRDYDYQPTSKPKKHAPPPSRPSSAFFDHDDLGFDDDGMHPGFTSTFSSSIPLRPVHPPSARYHHQDGFSSFPPPPPPQTRPSIYTGFPPDQYPFAAHAHPVPVDDYPPQPRYETREPEVKYKKRSYSVGGDGSTRRKREKGYVMLNGRPVFIK